jgi:hypothetical protein
VAIARSGTARRLRRVYAGQLPAVSYVARIAPVLVTWLSTSRSGLSVGILRAFPLVRSAKAPTTNATLN